ncbi:hypothetical protein [Flammeovirga agarivorans]|uniref:Uncharacterized protein n=1 Tax=Flammeovirga agarivorans TaxID=2726742 RepID=A0A7X8SR83_9BACT|nr:hypothetical protein [Flammeovirga agarivorans]NLR94903.1 hypothetical protein [Flammeovirga agarivorans]
MLSLPSCDEVNNLTPEAETVSDTVYVQVEVYDTLTFADYDTSKVTLEVTFSGIEEYVSSYEDTMTNTSPYQVFFMVNMHAEVDTFYSAEDGYAVDNLGESNTASLHDRIRHEEDRESLKDSYTLILKDLTPNTYNFSELMYAHTYTLPTTYWDTARDEEVNHITAKNYNYEDNLPEWVTLESGYYRIEIDVNEGYKDLNKIR